MTSLSYMYAPLIESKQQSLTLDLLLSTISNYADSPNSCDAFAIKSGHISISKLRFKCSKYCDPVRLFSSILSSSQVFSEMDESLSAEEISPTPVKRRGKYCVVVCCIHASYHFFEFPKDAQRRNS